MGGIYEMFASFEEASLASETLENTGPEAVSDAGNLFDQGEVRYIPEVGNALTTGHPFEAAPHLDYEQGDNSLGYRNNCGLVSVANMGQLFGMGTTEEQITRLADEQGLCNNNPWIEPAYRGGVNDRELIGLLEQLGLTAEAYDASSAAGGLEAIAGYIEEGRGVTIGVNAGVLWDEPSAVDAGNANHQILVTGACRDLNTGSVVGLFVCDSGRHLESDACRFVSVEILEEAYVNVPFASAVVTAQTHT